MPTVKSLLDKKGWSEVVTIQKDYSVGEACKLLRKHNIGALVVINESNSIVGIFSERDLVRIVADYEENSLSLPVSEYMTPKVKTITLEETIEKARTEMRDGHFRHLPVVADSGALIGIISASDITDVIATEMTILAQQLEDYIKHG